MTQTSKLLRKNHGLWVGGRVRISISLGSIREPFLEGFICLGNSAPKAAVACPSISKMNMAGMAEISKPPTFGILLRNIFK